MLNLDFVLFEPARSADPPIKLFFNLNNEFKTASEDFLVANGFKFAITSFFCFIIELEKLLLNNSFNLFLFLEKSLFHFVSILEPLTPIFLHSFKIFFGISNGLKDQFKFCLTNSISLGPRGLP